MSAQLLWVWLAQRDTIGPQSIAALLQVFGTPEAVYEADRAALTASCPLRKSQVDALCDKDTAQASAILRTCAEKGISVLTLGDSAYPDRLRNIPDPPAVLYLRGTLPNLDDTPAIAVVGTRAATPYGESTAEALGRSIGQAGMIVVSGMAKGCDGCAQRGALRSGGKTIAVLAGGADVCYPPENRALMGDILLSGCIVSEHPPGTEPRAEFFPPRNRILSGLSVATVVVEAADYRSGALITARRALEQGRDVYAVPGGLNAPQSKGCNELIARGEAALLMGPEDLVRAYQGLMREKPDEALVRQAFWRQVGKAPDAGEENAWDAIREREKQGEKRRQSPKSETPAPLPENLSAEEKTVAELVRGGCCSPTEILERCELPAARVMAIITMLEMDGVVHREQGKLFLH